MLVATRLESAVDYLTAVTLFQETTSLMLNRADLMGRNEARLGNMVHPWGMAGFDGFRVGQVQFGSRGNEGIVRLSGHRAAMDWFDIYQLCDRVTRVDVQETYRLAEPVTPFILKNYKSVRAWSKAHRKKLAVSIWHNSYGGCTLYIGSRQSEVLCRVYNKEVESGEVQYVGCVRFEGEFKAGKARDCARHLSSGRPVPEVINGILSPLLSNRACSFPTLSANPQVALRGSSPKNPDATKSCQWLHDAVRPTVRFVLDNLGPCALREALQLSDDEIFGMLDCNGPNDKPTN